MAELKTKPNDLDVVAFLNNLPDERQRRDAFAILELMRNATGAEASMYGTGIIGFGVYQYT